jgi:hypothetical protein
MSSALDSLAVAAAMVTLPLPNRGLLPLPPLPPPLPSLPLPLPPTTTPNAFAPRKAKPVDPMLQTLVKAMIVSPLPLPLYLHPLAQAEYERQKCISGILRLGASLAHFADSKHQFSMVSVDKVCKTYAFWYGRDSKGQSGNFTLTLLKL